MVILHITNIENNPYSGVSVVVPQHIIAQNFHETVGVINVNNIYIDELKSKYAKNTTCKIQINCPEKFDVKELVEPFDSPDIVVFQECYCIRYIQIANNLRVNNIPYIICPHGELRSEALKNKWLKKKIANVLMFNNFIRHSCGIQCLSNKEKESINYDKNKFVCTNGVNVPPEQKKYFNTNLVKFIYIGRYDWKVKGLDLLFDAIASIESFLKEHHCRFYLYGPDGIVGWIKQVEMLAHERRIDEFVEIHSEVSGIEKKNLLIDADIFVQTSRHEGMPMAILEALSYGLPCLVTEGTSIGKEIEKNMAGWCAENTSDSIAAAIINAVKSKEKWNEYGMNGINYIEHNHSWEKESKRAINRYKEIIDLNDF